MQTYFPLRDPSDLASALKQRRRQLELNQSDVAGMHDVSRFTIVDAESGKGDPKLSTLLTLFEALGLTLVAVPSQLAERLLVPDGWEEAPRGGRIPDDPDIDDADWDIEGPST